jgi:hypothetical protein
VSRLRAVVGFAVLLVAGCSAPRIVPVPAAGVEIDVGQGSSATVAAEDVRLTVQPSAWRGSPWDLRDCVTPFLVSLWNGIARPLEYDYTGFRLFDDSRFQYIALPPTEVERILRWRAGDEERLAAAGPPPPIRRRRVVSDAFGWWGWDPWGWYSWPGYYYPGPPPLGDVYLQALPMATLQPSAWIEGFVYFPRLRATTRTFSLQFHHRLGEMPRILTLSFAFERDGTTSPGA